MHLPLEEIKGPRCPKCACRRTTFMAHSTYRGKTTEIRKCDYCGKSWRHDPGIVAEPEPQDVQALPEDDGIIQYTGAAPGGATCPKCGAFTGKVKRTMPVKDGVVVRYHKCVCKKSFRSEERI